MTEALVDEPLHLLELLTLERQPRRPVSPTIWGVHFLLSYITAAIYCAKYAPPDGSLRGVRWAIAAYTILATDNHTSQIGIKRKPRRGTGLEFQQLREYRLGDSLRQLDWKATSRRQKRRMNAPPGIATTSRYNKSQSSGARMRPIRTPAPYRRGPARMPISG